VSTTWRAGVVALVGVWCAQVSIPLLDRGQRATPTNVVVALLAVAAGCFVAHAAGVRGVAAVAVACAVGLGVEVLGTRTGFPFGSYRYTTALRPQVIGVPVAVVLAWAGMGIPAWAVACALHDSVAVRIALGAIALAGWDLFLDPQMVTEGYWVWPEGGTYRGIPISNYAGWLVASAVLMVLLHLLLPSLRSTPLVAVYLLMSVMETLGFVAFFGDPVVGLAGGVVCLPLAILAVQRSRGVRALLAAGRLRKVAR
jgi:uncharacterized membrane protein